MGIERICIVRFVTEDSEFDCGRSALKVLEKKECMSKKTIRKSAMGITRKCLKVIAAMRLREESKGKRIGWDGMEWDESGGG